MLLQVAVILKKQEKKSTRNIEMLKKLLSSQGTLTAFINMKIDKYFNMKILNIHNILLAMSLGGFSPNSAKYYADVHGMLSNSHGFGWGFQMPCLHERQLSLVIFGAAGMCNGRERSGR